MERPTTVNVLGKTYKIKYVDNPADVDLYRRKSLWGQIDYWTRTIRIYDKDRTSEDVFETLIHEITHGIAEPFKLELEEETVALLSIGLADVLIRNNWVAIGKE